MEELTKTIKSFYLLLMASMALSCGAQTNQGMENNSNPLLCNPEEGVCGIPDSLHPATLNTKTTTKQIKLVYYTDPICSACWGIEPQLRKLKLEYGALIEIEYRMGGLLPDWNYNSGGISKPSDVAHHWDEVSKFYDMPIDGDVWLEDPLHSSYPPSIAFKAAQMQSEEKALLFLREIGEMVFLQKVNIAREDQLLIAAKNVGLDVSLFKKAMERDAVKLFEDDLSSAKKSNVRGFPTLIFMNNEAEQVTVYGSKPYANFENAINVLLPQSQKSDYSKDWKSLFDIYPTLTAKEFSILSNITREQSEAFLNGLKENGELNFLKTKNGNLWRRK